MKKIWKVIKKIVLTPWFFWDPDFPIDKEQWRMHKYDADQNFPSVPHMDCITDGRKKMDIYTGEIYIRKTLQKHKASKKDLQRLWANSKFREIVYVERQRYLEVYGKEYEKPIPEIYVEEYERKKTQNIKDAIVEKDFYTTYIL